MPPRSWERCCGSGSPNDGRGPDRMALGEGWGACPRERPEWARHNVRRHMAESHAVKIAQCQPGQCIGQDERTEQPDAGAQGAEIMGCGVVIGMSRTARRGRGVGLAIHHGGAGDRRLIRRCIRMHMAKRQHQVHCQRAKRQLRTPPDVLPKPPHVRFFPAVILDESIGKRKVEMGAPPYRLFLQREDQAPGHYRGGRIATASTSMSAPSRASFWISSVVLAGGAAVLTNLSRMSRTIGS